MRVLVVHGRYRSVAPSGENNVVDQESAVLAAAGHQVGRFERHSDDIEGWSLPRKATLPATSLWNEGVRRDLARRLERERPDVVHVHNTFPLLSPSVLHACREARVPVVATIHNYKLLCASGDFFRQDTPCHDCASGRARAALKHGCYRGSRVATAPVVAAQALHRSAWQRLVAAYIFISANQRDLMQHLDLPPSRVFVKHNLVPDGRTPAVDRDHSVVFLGRLDPAKGIRFLMRAWDLFRTATPESPLRLVIAGGGPLADSVAAWAAGHPSVDVAGMLGPDEAAGLLRRSVAAVVPSQWEETFGLVAVEAMAAGVAPVAPARGSFPELITHGVDGALFEPADANALAAVLRDVDRRPEEYVDLGRTGRKTYLQRFHPAPNLEELLAIYRYAIEHPVHRPGSG